MFPALRGAMRTVLRRWRRNVLTLGAMAVGTAAAVAMLGISHASADQVVERLQAYEPTAVVAALPAESWSISETKLLLHAKEVSGLTSVGTLVLPQSGSATLEIQGARTGEVAQSGLTVATAQGLASRGVTFTEGAFPSDLVISRDPTLLVLGSALARELNVTTESGSNRVIVLGRVATVVGVIKDGANLAALATTIVMTPASAAYFDQLPPSRQLNVEVVPGLAEEVASLLPLALYPQSPSSVSLIVPPSPELLRSQLTADATGLVVVITSVTSGATLFGIITTMQISVWERRREIGLSRALGMTSGGIARVFFWESVILATGGALLGWILGVFVSSVVTLASGRELSLPLLALAIPVIGIGVGALAGVIPARSASSIDPAELLRS